MSKQFFNMAKQAFAFLEDAGFHLASTEPNQLRYETARVFTTVEWDSRSGELDVFIGLQPKKGESQDTFSLTNLFRMENVNVLERKMSFQVADENKLGPFLEKLAEDMRAHAWPALAGDRMFFRRLNALGALKLRLTCKT